MKEITINGLKFQVRHELGYELEIKDANKTVDVPVTLQLRMSDIEDIIVTMYEGGVSSFWLKLDNTGPDWDVQPKDMPTSQYLFSLLAAGKSVKFMDNEGTEDDRDWILTMDKLIKGIAQEVKNHQTDLGDIDAVIADRIIQYALFDDVVYG